MFERLKMKAALKNAEKIREDRDKIARAIKTEETKLLKFIAGRVEADTALVDAETAAALGEPSPVNVARQRSTDAMASINRQASVLGGLRSRLAAQASELEAGVRGIQSGLPEHLDALRQNFAAEWTKGVSVFGALLGKRKALEALVGRFDL